MHWTLGACLYITFGLFCGRDRGMSSCLFWTFCYTLYALCSLNATQDKINATRRLQLTILGGYVVFLTWYFLEALILLLYPEFLSSKGFWPFLVRSVFVPMICRSTRRRLDFQWPHKSIISHKPTSGLMLGAHSSIRPTKTDYGTYHHTVLFPVSHLP